jgi:hypothetical protein
MKHSDFSSELMEACFWCFFPCDLVERKFPMSGVAIWVANLSKSYEIDAATRCAMKLSNA